jgi:CubicO group peptidase (beta-lactamase class C family)
LQLVEKRKHSLDQTVNTWYPEPPKANQFTGRMLLSHTGGMNEYFLSPEVVDLFVLGPQVCWKMKYILSKSARDLLLTHIVSQPVELSSGRVTLMDDI